MRRILNLKGIIVIAVVAMFLAVATIYAAQQIFDVNIKTTVQLGISAEDPLQILSGDGKTPIESGDTISFGTVDVDFWGTGPVPVRKVFVKNTSNTPEHVVVTGDLEDGILPLFGFTKDDLKPWPDNGFDLAASGDTGDTIMGWLGLKFLDLTVGGKSTTIIFRATAITGDPGPDPIQPPAGMVAWWPGDGNANDIVGSNHGTLSGGVTFTGGMVQSAFSFPTTSAAVKLPGGSVNGLGDITFDAWIKPAADWIKGPFTTITIISGAGNIGDNEYVLYINTADKIFMQAKGTQDSVSIPGINDGNFHHVAWVRHSTGTNELYLDGVLKGTRALTIGALVIDQNGLWLGQEQDCVGGCFSATQAFTGVIDEVEIFNSALSAAEIKAIYDAGSAGKIKP